MEYYILTKYKFIVIVSYENKYKSFIEILQDFYNYHFDFYNLELNKDGFGYTATSLTSLKDEMSNCSKSNYIEIIENQLRRRYSLGNSFLEFQLINEKDLIKYFPDIEI